MRLKDLAPDEAARVATLLDEALALAPAQRAAWQAELRQREARLSSLVNELLMSIDSGATDGPADDAAAGVASACTAGRIETIELVARGIVRALPDAAALEGRRFGPYRVLRLLGRGGMGSVWLAERADGLFERQVALKLVHPSLIDAALNERFARERSILGALAHPNIARLLDAGVAESSQPYLALEYVEGTAIDAYCDARRLDLRARVELVMQVLSAVQYAHQNLVIHRDLKPANILVTEQGEVRLLDFGIAKLMTDGQAQATELTQQLGGAMTPEYASPEQIAGRAVGTASDVYSIGVLLYALLCGQRPYRLQRDSRLAMENAIVALQPVRPSQQPISSEIALARTSTPKLLARALAGDLDTIVLKALKKVPAERYPTADALHQDLRRHLAGEPVEARPDSTLYRIGKFVARHRVQAGVGVLVGVTLLAATGVSLRQAQLAREEAQRAQAVQGLLHDIFAANTELQPDPLRAQQTTARELLDIGARKAAAGLQGSPQAQQEVLDTLADMYYQLRLDEDAARLRAQRVSVLKQAYGAADVRVAEALLKYADDLESTDRRGEAMAAVDEARAILDRLRDESSVTRGWAQVMSARLQQYVSLPAALRDATAAVAHFRAHPGAWSDLFKALQALARAHYAAGDFERAEALHRDALAEVERNVGLDSAWAITPLVQIAEAQYGNLKLDDAERNFRSALALAQRLNGDLAAPTLQTQAKVAAFLHATGKRDEGLRLLDDTQAAIAKPGANATPNVVATLQRARGNVLFEEGRIAEAEASFAAELPDLRAHYPGSMPLSRSLLLQAGPLTALGRYDVSRATLDEAWQLFEAVGGAVVLPAARNRYLLEQARLQLALEDPGRAEGTLQRIAPSAGGSAFDYDQLQARLLLAQARLQQRRALDAQALAGAALAEIDEAPLRTRFPALEAQAALLFGQALQRSGAGDAALPYLERALALRVSNEDATSPWVAQAKITLAESLLDQGARDRARALLDEASAAQQAHAELGAHLKVALAHALARVSAR